MIYIKKRTRSVQWWTTVNCATLKPCKINHALFKAFNLHDAKLRGHNSHKTAYRQPRFRDEYIPILRCTRERTQPAWIHRALYVRLCNSGVVHGGAELVWHVGWTPQNFFFSVVDGWVTQWVLSSTLLRVTESVPVYKRYSIRSAELIPVLFQVRKFDQFFDYVHETYIYNR